MKLIGILFKAEMVRAILDGRKTLTSRLRELDWLNDGNPGAWDYDGEIGGIHGFCNEHTSKLLRLRCPYGTTGDELWVRETFSPQPQLNAGAYYRATDPLVGAKRWTPGIHMPLRLSRIRLTVVRTWPSRLQDMTEEMAQKEGCYPVVHDDGTVDCGTRKTTFSRLWDSINTEPGKRWKDNPWVWRIEFRRKT